MAPPLAGAAHGKPSRLAFLGGRGNSMTMDGKEAFTWALQDGAAWRIAWRNREKWHEFQQDEGSGSGFSGLTSGCSDLNTLR